MREAVGKVGGYAIGFASVFGQWHIASVYLLSSVLFPPPVRVILKGIELAREGVLGDQVVISLQRILLGFLGGTLVGVPVGLAIGSFKAVRRCISPYTQFLRFTPATALATVAVIWFCIGQVPPALLGIYTTGFVVIIHTQPRV